MRTSLRGALALLLALSSPSWRGRAQETTPPTTQDWQNYWDAVETVKQRSASSKLALEQALQEKQGIEKNLRDWEKRYSDLLRSATEHSLDSTLSYEQALTIILILRQQLNDSSSLVDSLRADLKTQQDSEQVKIEQVQVAFELDVKRTKSDLFWTRVALAAVAVVAAGIGVAYVLKP
jgi:hypothetical protein